MIFILLFSSCEVDKNQLNSLCNVENLLASAMTLDLPSQKLIRITDSKKVSSVYQKLNDFYDIKDCNILTKEIYRINDDYLFYNFIFETKECGKISTIGIFNEEKFLSYNTRYHELLNDFRYKIDEEYVFIYCRTDDDNNSYLVTTKFFFPKKNKIMYRENDEGFTIWE